MKKLLNKPWFVATLALGAILLVGNSVLQGVQGTSSRGAQPTVAASSASAESESTAEESVRLPVRDALKALTVTASPLRDPFARRGSDEQTVAPGAKVAIPDFVDTVHVSALWTQSGATFTLINDRICQAGDEIGRLKVESATQDGVWITHWKGRDFVGLGGDFTLRTPVEKIMTAAVSSL